MSQQKSFSKKICLPFIQKCLHRQRGKTSSSQMEQGVEWQRLQFHRKRSAPHGAKAKKKNNTKKATEESSGIRYSLLAPFISATEKQKQQLLHPKGSLSITDSFQKSFHISSSLSDVLMGFSLVLLPSKYQKLSWEWCVRCGSSASLPAGSWGAAEEYVPPHRDALLVHFLPLPRLAMAATAAAVTCTSPLRAAGAGKRCRGGSRRNTDLSVPLGDFELTSGGCRVWQLEKQAGCPGSHRRCQSLHYYPC